MDGSFFLTLDIGATKLAAAVFTPEGEILYDRVFSRGTGTAAGEEAVYGNVRLLLEETLAAQGLRLEDAAGLGVGSPGPLDTRRGLILHAPLLGWRNFPLVERLQRDLGLPVVLDNDGNLGALAEQRRGAARGCQNIVYVTVSSGCGGGVLINGEIYHGAHDGAGEVGHMSINPEGPACPCGSRGCWELYASGTALLSRLRADLAGGKMGKSLLFDLAGGKEEHLSGKLLDEAAARGDPYALALYREEGFYLGVGLANLFNLFDPERIVLGGSVTRGRAFFHEALLETLRARCEQPLGEDSVVYAALGDRVVLYGAYWGAVNKVKPQRQKR
jgi:glucokinase